MAETTEPGMPSRALAVAIQAARLAGDLVETMRQSGVVSREKSDASPVTEADEAADALIRGRLLAAFPDDGWLSEESVMAPGAAPDCATWVVDPIDGTEAYIDGGVRGYAIHIARVAADGAQLGVVYEPRERLMMYAERGLGAFVQRGDGAAERVPDVAASAGGDFRDAVIRYVASPRTERWLLGAIDGAGFKRAGLFRSVGVKVGMLACGDAEVYPATHRLAVWDIAAPLALLECAGGKMTDMDGQRLPLPLAAPFEIGRVVVATRGPSGLHERICHILKGATEP